jgi:polyhydroxyalkanoate synthesis regulator phasin
MRVELEADEARELLSLLVEKLVQEAGLPDQDRARLRRWLSDEMRTGSPGMKELTEKVNADLERVLRSKEKSAVRRPDWL